MCLQMLEYSCELTACQFAVFWTCATATSAWFYFDEVLDEASSAKHSFPQLRFNLF